MALSELKTKRVERAVAAFMEKRRPPPHIRSQLDLGFRITGQSVEIFETRPDWQNPKESMEILRVAARHNFSLSWTAGRALHFELATPAAAGYFSRYASIGS